MSGPMILQDRWVSASGTAKLCSFDYEAIQEPTKPLIHQASRFLYIKHGKGVIRIDGKNYELRPNTLVALTPWKVSEVIEVAEMLQFIRLVYDYQYFNALLKTLPGMEAEASELLRFIKSQPVAHLDSVQAAYIDELMECLKGDLGVESCCINQPDKPLTQLYILDKVVDLMIMFRRSVLPANLESGKRGDGERENSILSYIYTHASEKLTVSDVAATFFLSESTLAKKIADATGLGFVKLLTSIRIEKASNYLIYTDLTLDEIAPLVGYVDASHLSKHFVSEMGMTPRAYRVENKSSAAKFDTTKKHIAYCITEYIYLCFADEKITAKLVAERFHVSTAEMNQLLLYYAEKNFETLLHYVRVNRACELLITTEYQIIDIAMEVGYKNIKTFNLNFQKVKGMTPTQFRESITLQNTEGSETRIRKTRDKKRTTVRG